MSSLIDLFSLGIQVLILFVLLDIYGELKKKK